jgi:GntR family transcriptional regulator, arabinose operon transcriptional repressor
LEATGEERTRRGFVCVIDKIAGLLMQAALVSKYRIPRDLRVVGIDDLGYSRLLPVPLTTIHQPCREIGQAAMAVMCDRFDQPDMPTRDILLNSKLVIRQSCGALTH